MDIQTQEIHTKNGRNFSKKTLRQILTNPIYKGYISHKGAEYKGRHKAIIDEIKFKEVQDIFRKDSKERCSKPSNALLKDLIRCELCDCTMTPTYCNRHHRKYRYYTCSNHLRKKSCTSENKILPAGDVEEFVVKIVRKLLKDPAITTLTIHNLAEAGIPPEKSQEALKNIDKLWETLHSQEQQKIIKLLIQNVVVNNDGIRILLNHNGMQELIQGITDA